MKDFIKMLALMFGVAFLAAGCEDLDSDTSYVRFENRSATKTVCPIWDGAKVATLAPGQKTDYMEENPGTHTLKWINAANNQDLTTTSWPSLVEDSYYTFPYSD